VVGIVSPGELERAYARMMDAIRQKAGDARIDGVLVQKAMPRGVKVVIGGIRNGQFGPVVMFGLGGTLVEVFKDVSFRLAPLKRDEALR
jgi:acyl-CoA synthetase (NDP forming)